VRQVVHVLEKAPELWSAPKGYINADIIKEYVAGPDKNVKVLVCGPPPQLAAIAGKKDGAKQGTLGGALKELGYTEEQVYKF
jgi:cytochrome-b5 reductase